MLQKHEQYDYATANPIDMTTRLLLFFIHGALGVSDAEGENDERRLSPDTRRLIGHATRENGHKGRSCKGEQRTYQQGQGEGTFLLILLP